MTDVVEKLISLCSPSSVDSNSDNDSDTNMYNIPYEYLDIDSLQCLYNKLTRCESLRGSSHESSHESSPKRVSGKYVLVSEVDPDHAHIRFLKSLGFEVHDHINSKILQDAAETESTLMYVKVFDYEHNLQIKQSMMPDSVNVKNIECGPENTLKLFNSVLPENRCVEIETHDIDKMIEVMKLLENLQTSLDENVVTFVNMRDNTHIFSCYTLAVLLDRFNNNNVVPMIINRDDVITYDGACVLGNIDFSHTNIYVIAEHKNRPIPFDDLVPDSLVKVHFFC